MKTLTLIITLFLSITARAGCIGGELEGKAPTQTQVQRNNFLKVMQGAEMYREQVRRGTAIEVKR